MNNAIPMCDVWMGNNGHYKVPAAISDLARLAQERTGRPYDPRVPYFEEQPYFRVVQEWALWRDQQDSEEDLWEFR